MKKLIFNFINFLSIILLFEFSFGKDVCIDTNSLSLRILEVSNSGLIAVEISNQSKEPIKIFKESNSWGAFRFRVLLIQKDCVGCFFQNSTEVFTKNAPTCDEISIGGHITKKLNLNDGTWNKMWSKNNIFDQKDIIIAIYEVPNSDEAIKRKVWHGMIATYKKL